MSLARIKGLRRLMKWCNQWRISKHKKKESQKQKQDPKNLKNFEKKVFSQNGEDGIIEEIFLRIGTINRYFVEFGVEDARECNCRYLLENRGWSGLWIDGSKENIDEARNRYKNHPVQLIDRFITKENINSLFKEANVPKEFDLLSIDIDGNDYWIWQELTEYSPRAVIIEYNASIKPEKHWVYPYDAHHIFDGSRHYGASLSALVELGKTLGYSLVGCDSQGVNAFFIRNDLLNNQFSYSDNEAIYHYTCPKYHGYHFGHPPQVQVKLWNAFERLTSTEK